SAETSSTISFFENFTQLSNLITVKIHIFNQHISDSEFTEKAAVVRSYSTIIITLSIKKKVHNSNMSIITCSNLSIKLLNSFSSNSIMIFEINFLFLIKKHLFLTILSFFQD